MKNSDYWKQRFIQLENAQNQTGEAARRYIESQYREAQNQLDAKITMWYQRFADNNGITLGEVKQYMQKADLKEFKWTVDEYIKYGKENDGTGRWMKELENASAKFHVSKYEALKIHIRQAIEELYAKQSKTVDKTMKNIYKSGYYHTAYELQKGFGIGWDIAGINPNKLEKVVGKPWAVDGVNFSERIWKNKDKLISELHKEIKKNLMLGENPKNVIDAISTKMKASRKNAGKLVMTESAYFSSLAQKDCFKDLDVEKYQIVATLDSHTSETCRDLDGKVFEMEDFEPGTTAPPFHPWCRTTTVPYFDDDFGDVGERAARDEKTGKTYYVPGNLTYRQWENAFVKDGDKSGLQEIENGGIISDDNWIGLNYEHLYTKQTAIDRLQSEYGIQFQDSKKYPMDGELLSDCVGWLDSFSTQYPGFMKKNPCKIPVIKNNAPSKMKGSVGWYSRYVSLPNVEELALNGKYHSDVIAFQEYVENRIQSKWYPANATIHKTFIHEFGHHVSNSMRWITNNPDWEKEFINECIKEFKKIEPNYTYTNKTYDGMGDYVSRYGATSETELFAEAFAEYFGGENPRDFAKIFGKELDKLLKGL